MVILTTYSVFNFIFISDLNRLRNIPPPYCQPWWQGWMIRKIRMMTSPQRQWAGCHGYCVKLKKATSELFSSTSPLKSGHALKRYLINVYWLFQPVSVKVFFIVWVVKPNDSVNIYMYLYNVLILNPLEEQIFPCDTVFCTLSQVWVMLLFLFMLFRRNQLWGHKQSYCLETSLGLVTAHPKLHS